MNMPEDPWAAATFEGNEREQLQRWAKMTLTEKVRWLEEAQRLALKLQHTMGANVAGRAPLPSSRSDEK